MNPDEANEEETDNRLERLPQGAERANGQESLRTALAIAQRVHRANPTLSPAIQPDHREIWRLSEETKLLEAQALSEWAINARLMLDADEFTHRWFESGCIEGGENQVFSVDGIVYKRNNVAFHTSYFEYFERLIVHNWLFPDTYYTFLGLMWVRENDEFPQLRPVVSPAGISGRSRSDAGRGRSGDVATGVRAPVRR